MKKIGIYCLLGAVLVSGAFSACSDKKEPEDKKGAIDEITDKAAKEMVDRFKAPLDKAREAAKKGEERVKELDEAMKKH